MWFHTSTTVQDRKPSYDDDNNYIPHQCSADFLLVLDSVDSADFLLILDSVLPDSCTDFCIQSNCVSLLDFVSVLAFRQQHSLHHYFNISDLYFVCRMRPNTHDIHPCQDEILKCRWMSVEELATTGETTPLSHRTAQMLLEARQKGFHTFDIGMQEVPMNFPDYTTSRKYKLFMKSDGS